MILSDFENSTVGYKKSTGEPGLGFDKIMKTATHARTQTQPYNYSTSHSLSQELPEMK